jgi:membrane protein implicated in regulation of membrane protease activity
MPWWGWIVLGFVLLLGELLTPGGFYLFFFGIGALIVGALSGWEWVKTEWIEWLLFSILSTATLLVSRRPLLKALQLPDNKKEVDTLSGETGTALEDVAPGIVGKVELRGAPWSARNIGESPINRGQRCKVESREEFVLLVRKE